MAESKGCFVTGCASGIGAGLTTALLARGDRVFATDIDLPALEARARAARWSADRVTLARLDVRDAAAWPVVMEQARSVLGTVDVVVNDAGCATAAPIAEQTAEDVHRQVDVNLKGMIFGSQAGARVMKAQGHGHIVNIGSLSGVAPIPGIGVYSATKFGIRGFSLALAQELRPYGIAVTVVNPDGVDTPLLASIETSPDAAYIFSGPGILTVDQVVRAVLERALPRRPLEVCLPASRGWLAKLVSLLPPLSLLVAESMHRKGRAAQARLQAEKLRLGAGVGAAKEDGATTARTR